MIRIFQSFSLLTKESARKVFRLAPHFNHPENLRMLNFFTKLYLNHGHRFPYGTRLDGRSKRPGREQAATIKTLYWPLSLLPSGKPFFNKLICQTTDTKFLLDRKQLVVLLGGCSCLSLYLFLNRPLLQNDLR